MWVYLDIETTPPWDRPPDPAKVKVPKNYKDPKTIAAYRAENAYEQWADGATSPHLAKVFVICAAIDDGPVFSVQNASEGHCVTSFGAWLEEHAPLPVHHAEPSPILCAFNGVSFDFKLLALRASKYGMPALARRLMPTNSRYGDSTHRDPFVALGHEGKMHEWADFFGLDYTPEPDWLYKEWARAGRNEYVAAKCAQDVHVLRELTDKLRAGGMM